MKNKTTPSVICQVPIGLDSKMFDDTVFEVCELLKRKELTIKQAQLVLDCCNVMVLESMVGI